MLRNVGYVIGGILFLLLLYYALLALPLVVQDAPRPDPNAPDQLVELQQLGAVGEYLGYLVGVPAAIGGALAAVAIALNTDSVAKRQLQLEAAKFRDGKTDEIKNNIRDFAERLQLVRKTGAQLVRRMERVRNNVSSTVELIDAVENDATVIESFERLNEAFDDLSRSILSLASNEIVHASVEGQRTATENKIRDAVKRFWGDQHVFDFERDILDIREKIDFLQQDRTIGDAAAAMLLMPAGFHTLDFLGAYIKLADKSDHLAVELLREQALRKDDELFNYGLALIASLYQLLPSDQTITDTITRIYKIRDLRLRPAAQFKAREVYFSRSTVEVVGQAIDGERLFLRVVSPDLLHHGAVNFHEDNSQPRKNTVERITNAVFGR